MSVSGERQDRPGPADGGEHACRPPGRGGRRVSRRVSRWGGRRTGRRDGGRGRDSGQTAIEFVGVFPLIILLLVALWQCALIGYTFSLAGNAADVGARVGTTAPYAQETRCIRAAKEDLPNAWSGKAEVDCVRERGLYRAIVKLHVPVLVPGVLNFPFPVEGNATSVKES
ncbi:TadE family protein [Streptomyces sp. NPDC093085]|uniref:TadE family protein n=1 Tax=Streptomyces sp. NPDC093085 TaxID=3155068 RepID=UPI003416C7CE